jgi:hypothetical protein
MGNKIKNNPQEYIPRSLINQSKGEEPQDEEIVKSESVEINNSSEGVIDRNWYIIFPKSDKNIDSTK